MRLKTAIQIITNLHIGVLIASFFGVLVIIRSSSEGRFLIFEILILVVIAISYIFRMSIINCYVKKCPYPTIFLGVLNKLNLIRNFDIQWSDADARELMQPTYPTEAF